MSSVQHQRRMVLRLLMISLVIFLVSLWGWMERKQEAAQEAAQEAVTSETRGLPREVSHKPAPPEERAPRSYTPGAKTPIPRPVTTNTGGARSQATEEDEAPPADGPVDRREDPGPDGPELVQVIKATMEDLEPEIEDCLTQWWMLDPALEGEVMMSFTLGPDGLGEVNILDHTDIPMGPLSCFGAAIYEADWPDSEDPLQITYPFTFFNEAPQTDPSPQ